MISGEAILFLATGEVVVFGKASWLGAMENVSKTLLATPEGLFHLFFDGGVSVECLARAFETDTQLIEASLREAMRKRDAIKRAATPRTLDVLRTVGDAA